MIKCNKNVIYPKTLMTVVYMHAQTFYYIDKEKIGI